MFEWLFGKECQCCGVKIPRGIKPYEGAWCSEKCEDIDYDVREVVRNSGTYSIKDMNENDKRRINTLKEEIERNYSKMKLQFAS